MPRFALHVACGVLVAAEMRPDMLNAVLGEMHKSIGRMDAHDLLPTQPETPTLIPEADEKLLELMRPEPLPRYHPMKGCHFESSVNFCYASPNVLSRLMHKTDPGLVIEYGSFLGETTIALAQVLAEMPGTSASTRIVAIDTWQDSAGYQGIWTKELKWTAPSALREESVRLGAQRPLPFLAFYRNIAANRAIADRIIPLPLQQPDQFQRAHAIGMNASTRPKLVYINPRVSTIFHQLTNLWPLLDCGGTMAGHGYHLPAVQRDVNEFALRHLRVHPEAHVVHAPGAARYENIGVPYSEQAMINQTKSNFSYWVLHKPCTQ